MDFDALLAAVLPFNGRVVQVSLYVDGVDPPDADRTEGLAVITGTLLTDSWEAGLSLGFQGDDPWAFVTLRRDALGSMEWIGEDFAQSSLLIEAGPVTVILAVWPRNGPLEP